MNPVPPAPSGGGFLGSVDPGISSYGISVTLGIVILIITVAMASYHCTRAPPPAASVTEQRPLATERSPGHIEAGLDEATLLSYPKVLYSKTNKEIKEATATCCAICLEDYNGNDTVRVLPDCGHLFHVKCVDPWIRQHPTCPVCRTSPIPTPMVTPLVQVVPLASGSMV